MDIELPICFEAPDSDYYKLYVLRIDRSLYGLKQAGYNWFAKLSYGLHEGDFVQSNIGPCIFFGHKCIVLTYVDNCINVGDTHNHINTLIQSWCLSFLAVRKIAPK